MGSQEQEARNGLLYCVTASVDFRSSPSHKARRLVGALR